MGELKIQYSHKEVSPFSGMKLLKDFIDTTNIIKDLESINLPQPQSNTGINSIDIIKEFCLAIFTGASRYIHDDWLRGDTVLQENYLVNQHIVDSFISSIGKRMKRYLYLYNRSF